MSCQKQNLAIDRICVLTDRVSANLRHAPHKSYGAAAVLLGEMQAVLRLAPRNAFCGGSPEDRGREGTRNGEAGHPLTWRAGRRLCSCLGLDRKSCASSVSNAFRGKWKLVHEVAREPLRRVLPPDPTKGCVLYDVKKRPSEYVAATYRLCVERACALAMRQRFRTNGRHREEAVRVRNEVATRADFNDWGCWTGAEWTAN